jgi:tetratricopeptide (TPR) repeat protein
MENDPSKDAQEKLERYLYRLMKLKEAQQQALTPRILQQVADELGLHDDDLALIQQVAQAHQQRASTYEQAGRFPEAEREWKAAAELLPLSPDPQHGLAALYLRRWQESALPAHREDCERQVDALLQLAPQHAGGLEILRQIDRKRGRVRTKRAAFLLGMGLLAAVALAGGIVLLALFGAFEPGAHGLEGQAYEVPSVTVAPSPEIDGMELQAAQLRIVHSDYQGSRQFDFYFTGRLRFPQHDLRALRLGIDFFDEAGRQVATHYLWATGSVYEQGDDESAHRVPAGCWAYLNGEDSWMPEFTEMPVRIASARLRHDLTNRISPLANAAQPLALAWKSLPTEGISLEGRLLFWAAGPESDPASYRLAAEIAHVGTQPCRALIAELQWLLPDSTVGHAQEAVLISERNLPLQPGERLFLSQQEYFHPEEDGQGAPRYIGCRVAIKRADAPLVQP